MAGYLDSLTIAWRPDRPSPPVLWRGKLFTASSGYANFMLTRFVVYGTMGWIVEILWTGFGSLLRRDPRLRAQTYLWMFPIYGGGAIAFERLHWQIMAQPWFVRGLIWCTAIFAVEYASGWVVRRVVGQCPWDYREAPLNVAGLIRLDYAPAWFVLGLLFEQVHMALIAVVS